MRASKDTLELVDASYNSINRDIQRALLRCRRTCTMASLRVILTGNVPRKVTLPAPRSMVGVLPRVKQTGEVNSKMGTLTRTKLKAVEAFAAALQKKKARGQDERHETSLPETST
jgi:hypothetical protein